LRRFLLVIFCSFSCENRSAEESTYITALAVQTMGSISFIVELLHSWKILLLNAANGRGYYRGR
jgi:hypothetical protein